MNNQEHIENVIKRSYDILQKVYELQQENAPRKNIQDSGSRILFPTYRNGNTRFSEQELRFIFVEQLNIEIAEHKWDVFYSVETPTKYRYKFKDEITPQVYKDENKGQSAQFDLVIHDNRFNRIALIEFKANNASIAHHDKDFLKLKEEGSDSVMTYFLEVVKSSDAGTVDSLKEKKTAYSGVFKCWSCSEKKYII